MDLQEERNELKKDLTEALDLIAELINKYELDEIDEEYAQELIDREGAKYGERLDEYIIQDD
jgi:hypothetical protein